MKKLIMIKMENRSVLIKKLKKEGISDKTLSVLSDKQINLLSERLLNEQIVDTTKNKMNTIKVSSKMNPNIIQKVTRVGKESGAPVEIAEKDEKWIQKAVNPKHKGYCTPTTKKTCTPKRKSLAKRFKKGIESEENIKEWIDKTVSEKYHSMTTKNEIMEVIKKKLNEQSPLVAPPRIKPADPKTVPGKPERKEREHIRKDPWRSPGPGKNPEKKMKGDDLPYFLTFDEIVNSGKESKLNDLTERIFNKINNLNG